MGTIAIDIRKWGEWMTRSFQSGTVVVGLLTGHKSPYERPPSLYVFGDKGQSDEDYQNQRYRMARSLVEYLNGGNRPDWLDGFKRKSEVEIEGPNGASIVSSGPSYDANPPNLNWKQVDTEEAKEARFVITEFFIQ